jgi:homoserine O-acetyltransferase/O-succinyltransferase
MSDWKREANSRELLIPNFAFDGGGQTSLHLECRTLGQLNAAKDNAILLLHGTTGSSAQFLQPKMAEALFAEDGPLDMREYFLVIPDAIGHGESSKPSTESGEDFPQYTYHDIVRAQKMVVQQLFGIDRLRLILGTSMGGMNTWMWGILYSGMSRALMPIACLPRKISGLNLLFRRLMLAIIESNPSEAEGAGFAWDLFGLLTQSPARLHGGIRDPSAADAWLKDMAERSSQTTRMDALWEFRAALDYDPADDLHRIRVPLLSINFADDQINSPGFAELADDIQHVVNGRSVIINASDQSYGHQTHSHADVWQHYVSDLLNASS